MQKKARIVLRDFANARLDWKRIGGTSLDLGVFVRKLRAGHDPPFLRPRFAARFRFAARQRRVNFHLITAVAAPGF